MRDPVIYIHGRGFSAFPSLFPLNMLPCGLFSVALKPRPHTPDCSTSTPSLREIKDRSLISSTCHLRRRDFCSGACSPLTGLNHTFTATSADHGEMDLAPCVTALLLARVLNVPAVDVGDLGGFEIELSWKDYVL